MPATRFWPQCETPHSLLRWQKPRRAKICPSLSPSLDVDSDTSVAEGIAALTKAHGQIDVLINNAGVEAMGSVEETPLHLFRSVMETNYFGVIRCTQAVVPQMRERGSGCIVQISSVAGRLTQPPMAAYCASKWALEAMTEALAGEMKTFGVRVALVEPGVIDTPCRAASPLPAPRSMAKASAWPASSPSRSAVLVRFRSSPKRSLKWSKAVPGSCVTPSARTCP